MAYRRRVQNRVGRLTRRTLLLGLGLLAGCVATRADLLEAEADILEGQARLADVLRGEADAGQAVVDAAADAQVSRGNASDARARQDAAAGLLGAAAPWLIQGGEVALAVALARKLSPSGKKIEGLERRVRQIRSRAIRENDRAA